MGEERVIRKFDVDPDGIICSVWRQNRRIDKAYGIGIRISSKYANLHEHMMSHMTFYQNNYIYEEETQTFLHGPQLPKFPSDFVEDDTRPIKSDGVREMTWYGFSEEIDGTTKEYPETIAYNKKIEEAEFQKGALKHGDYD